MRFRLGQYGLCLSLLSLLWPVASWAQSEPGATVLPQPPLQISADIDDFFSVQRSDEDNPRVLQTAATEQAEFYLEDGTLLRLGGNTVLRLSDDAQSLQLSRGTLLLVSAGKTRVATPNATVEMDGAALFVRYIPGAETTVVGALTDGPAVTGSDAQGQQPLQAGQMFALSGQTVGTLYDFELVTFYETSRLADRLIVNTSRPDEIADVRLQATRQNMWSAVLAQQPIDEGPVLENPNFIGFGTAETETEAAGRTSVNFEMPDDAANPQGMTAESAEGQQLPSSDDIGAEPSASDTASLSEGETTTPSDEATGPDDALSTAPNVLEAVDFESSISAEINPEISPSDGNSNGGTPTTAGVSAGAAAPTGSP